MSDIPQKRWPWLWFAVCMVLLIALAGATIGLVAARRSSDAFQRAASAAQRAKAVAECTNRVLGARDELNRADHENERQKILDQRKASTDQNAGLAGIAHAKTRPEALVAYRLYERGSEEFQQALDGWLARDKAIALQRQAHPLGRC